MIFLQVCSPSWYSCVEPGSLYHLLNTRVNLTRASPPHAYQLDAIVALHTAAYQNCNIASSAKTRSSDRVYASASESLSRSS